ASKSNRCSFRLSSFEPPSFRLSFKESFIVQLPSHSLRSIDCAASVVLETIATQPHYGRSPNVERSRDNSNLRHTSAARSPHRATATFPVPPAPSAAAHPPATRPTDRSLAASHPWDAHARHSDRSACASDRDDVDTAATA